MLWKPYRLRKNWKFQKIIAGKHKVINRHFIIFYEKSQLDNCQFGISIPRKLVKRAVDRNCYKRQIRSLLIHRLKSYNGSCSNHPHHNHCRLVIIIRLTYRESDFVTNQESLYKLLSSIHFKK